MQRERPQDRRRPGPAQRQRRFALEQQAGGHGRQPPHPQSNGPGVERRHEHARRRGARALDDRRDAVDQRREDRAGRGSAPSAPRSPAGRAHTPRTPPPASGSSRPTSGSPRAGPRTACRRCARGARRAAPDRRRGKRPPRPSRRHHVQLDTVGAVGARPRERRDAVLALDRARAPVADDQGRGRGMAERQPASRLRRCVGATREKRTISTATN